MESKRSPSFSAFSILIVFLLLSLIGLALMPRLAVQLHPTRGSSSVSVSVHLPGASPQVTELELTAPIESALARLTGVSNIQSSSGAGRANISVYLDKWTDPDIFRFEAATILAQLHPRLPPGTSYPVVSLNRGSSSAGMDSRTQALIGYTINGPGTGNELRRMAEEHIQPRLADIEGIDQLHISGGSPQRLVIKPDRERMETIGLSVDELSGLLGAAFNDRDLGVLSTGEGRFNLALSRQIRHTADLGKFPLKTVGERLFYLRDIAELALDEAPVSTYYRINGENLISLTIIPQTGVNTIRLAAHVKDVIDEVAHALPPGHRVSLRFDNSEFLKDELSKIYFRTFLSVAILLLFVILITRKPRYLLIVALSLAVNVLLSFILYDLFGLQIHLYSLAGITISLGLIIDNVIVIVEDIRHTGRNRIFAAILASTLTALGALSVTFLLGETERVNLVDFAQAIIINLLVSLPVAYFFIPALLEKLPIDIRKGSVGIVRKRRLVRFSRFYDRQLQFMIRNRGYFVLLFVLCFGLPLYMLPNKLHERAPMAKTYNAVFGSDFYTKQLRPHLDKYLGGAWQLYVRQRSGSGFRRVSNEPEQVRLQVSVTMPNGATLPQMNAVVEEFETYLRGFDRELDHFTASITGPTGARLDILFKEAYKHGFPYQLKQLLEQKAIYSGSADFTVTGVGMGFNNAVNLENFDSTIRLKGYNFEQLQALALQLRDSLVAYPRVQEVLISTAERWGHKRYEEYVLRIDRPEYLALHGIQRNEINRALTRLGEQSRPLGYLDSSGPTGEPLTVELAANYQDAPLLWAAMNLPLQVNEATMLRMDDIAGISKIRAGQQIVRHNQEYLLNVHYRFIGTYQLNSMVQTRLIASFNELLPYGYSIAPAQLDGGFWGAGESGNSYVWFILLVLMIIYMICAVLLESFRQPLAVVCMIPFSFIGVFLIFYLLNLRFDQGGYASLLMLSGLVTNAALYIINDVNYFAGPERGRGRSADQRRRLYIRAFNAKAMPIVITTASAILSLLPFMISGHETGFWFTLSAGTIGGLVFSLLGAYLLLPLCLLPKKKKVQDG